MTDFFPRCPKCGHIVSDVMGLVPFFKVTCSCPAPTSVRANVRALLPPDLAEKVIFLEPRSSLFVIEGVRMDTFTYVDMAPNIRTRPFLGTRHWMPNFLIDIPDALLLQALHREVLSADTFLWLWSNPEIPMDRYVSPI